ncbi:F-actin-capping protein subunit alpha [Fragariocoptes setiger]|uniref:F-actin-capping protein subunit alpha n=1 Tax=Fragariocoptes setiger TaxID=1670756 RepID=A0ABQ7SC65_9ACAR|nr:F-actin-capping protein subunit alpha [Fragariocoptes setiger]
MTDFNQRELTSDEKAAIVSNFIINSPPGEFAEVLEDVREIVNDDQLVDDKVSRVFPTYTKDQLTPAKINGSEYPVILSEYNDLGTRFADPRSRQSFEYDHISHETKNLQLWEPDEKAEPWRAALELEWTRYCLEHYPEGASSVFSSFQDDSITLNACIEGHQFQSKKFWNGRWRSIWSLTFKPTANKKVDLTGVIKLHVHYYEDGNVQLVSSKDYSLQVNISTEEQTAKSIVEAVMQAENYYQRAISENYQTMSDTTFKALRRPLPVIRSKIEWSKIMSYKIGSELKQQ